MSTTISSQPVNANRLFLASCFALITTAFSFSIRAGILTQLGTELSLDPVQLGHINQMWFLGFPISMILGGVFYAKIGPKLIMQIAFVAHTIGIITTIYASSYNVLLISTLLIGLGNGCTEAACNPMIADAYSGNEFHSKLNRFHMWFPGGIVLGSLISYVMSGNFTNSPELLKTLGAVNYISVLLFALIVYNAGNALIKKEEKIESYFGIIGKLLKNISILLAALVLINTLLLTDLAKGLRLQWQAQIWVIMIPTIIYAILFFGQEFPKPRVAGDNTLANFKAMLNPLYLFMAACMALTAISEFGPQQWVGPILAKAGASPMLILALVTGLMAVGRYFAGPLVKQLNTVGVLLGSAIFGVIGIYMLSTMSGSMLYVAAVFYALGICYFWPNMLGFVGEHLPQTGALGLSILGGIGMFSSSMFQPIIGGWIKDNKVVAEASGLVGDAADLAAGQSTLSNMLLFPAILIVAFIGLYIYSKKLKKA